MGYGYARYSPLLPGNARQHRQTARRTLEMMMSFATPEWDRSLFFLLNDTWRNGVLDVAMPLVSNSLLVWGIAVACFAVAGWRSRQWKPLLAGLVLVALAAGAGDLTCNALKKEFGRVRPHNAMAGVRYVEDGRWQQRAADFVPQKSRGNSYVSAHAANSVAAAGMAVLLWPRLRLLWLLPLLIGYSRVYLGKHYPTDVLGGWLTGAAVLLVLCPLVPGRVLDFVRGGARRSEAGPQEHVPEHVPEHVSEHVSEQASGQVRAHTAGAATGV